MRGWFLIDSMNDDRAKEGPIRRRSSAQEQMTSASISGHRCDRSSSQILVVASLGRRPERDDNDPPDPIWDSFHQSSSST
jgi:hypothetical protein